MTGPGPETQCRSDDSETITGRIPGTVMRHVIHNYSNDD